MDSTLDQAAGFNKGAQSLGNKHKSTARRKEKTRRDSLETKIAGAMAQRRGAQHQFFP
jgi:hypothetical protein